MPSYVVNMIALAYGIPASEVVPMLQRWRGDPDNLTHQQISTRLAEKHVTASPQRISELILEGMGDDRPEPRKPREQKGQPA